MIYLKRFLIVLLVAIGFPICFSLFILEVCILCFLSPLFYVIGFRYKTRMGIICNNIQYLFDEYKYKKE